MTKIIIQQENEDGTKTIAFKDAKNPSKIAVITGKTPYVIDKQLVVKDKLKEALRAIRKEVSERMKLFVLLSKEGGLPFGEIGRRAKLDHVELRKYLLTLEKIGLVERRKLGRLPLYLAKNTEGRRRRMKKMFKDLGVGDLRKTSDKTEGEQ